MIEPLNKDMDTRPKGHGHPVQKKRIILLGAMVFSAVIFAASGIWGVYKGQRSYQYSEIVSLFENRRVSEYTLDLGSGELQFKLKGEERAQTYRVPDVRRFIDTIQAQMDRYNRLEPDNRILYDLKPSICRRA